MGKIAIHGFGRIGHTLHRIGLEPNLLAAAAISDIKDAPTLAALFQVETNYGLWPEPAEGEPDGFRIGGRSIPYFNAQKELPPGVTWVSTWWWIAPAAPPPAPARSPTLTAGPSTCS